MAGSLGQRVRKGIGGLVRGAGTRVARVEVGILKLHSAQIRLVQQQLLAGLAVQKITVEVVTEGMLKLEERLVARLERANAQVEG